MGRSTLLLVDSVINLALGVLLIAFPSAIVSALGIPPAESAFYPSILGAVLFGIGVALFIEWRPSRELAGLGLAGAIAINLCGGACLAGWLAFGKITLPARGTLILWMLVGILVAISLFEIVAHIRRAAP
jgi:hypothetical protein